jgi:hypothetical protein
MTRGPAPVVWKNAALPVAQNRGQVMIFSHSVRNLADFVIVGCGTLTFVRMRKVQCLHSPLETIAADLRKEVCMLQRIPGGPVSREVWAYSRYGVLRFFRVWETGLIELGADGKMIVTSPQETVSAGVPVERDVPGATGTLAPTGTGVAE